MRLTLIDFHSDEEINVDAKDPVILGRGPLFGCFDKKVSRNHIQLHLTSDGKVHIIAMHANPCFFMKNGLPPVFKIGKDEEKILDDGDYFGLLPDSFWYKIVVKDDNITTTFNNVPGVKFEPSSLTDETIVEDNVSHFRMKAKSDESNLVKLVERSCNDFKSDVVIKNKTSLNENVMKDSENNEIQNCILVGEERLAAVTTESDNKNEGDPQKSFTFHREVQIDHKVEELKQDNVSLEVDNNDLSIRLKELENTLKLPLWMYEIDESPKEKINLKRPLSNELIETTEKKSRFSDLNDGNSSSASILHDALSQEVKANTESSDYCPEVISEKNDTNEDSGDKNDVSSNSCELNVRADEEESVCPAPSSTQKRPYCQYEGSCYRKNEQHKFDFCHPGDPDFVPYENRPVCQYGSGCYRRNKLHLVEFQHPKTGADPGKGKRQKKKIVYQQSPDEYELEDPFIDDATSDEYVPSDLTSEEDAELTSESDEENDRGKKWGS